MLSCSIWYQKLLWDACVAFVKSYRCADACCCLQVHIVPPAENLCRLRDILDLHLPPHTQHQGSSTPSPAAVQRLQLHSDLSAPDRCYAVQANGVYISWSCPMTFLHQDVMHQTWAARYTTWVLINLMPKGVVFLFFSYASGADPQPSAKLQMCSFSA